MGARAFETLTSVGLFLLAVAMAWGAMDMPLGTLAMPGPGLVPVSLAVLLACASLAQMVFCFSGTPDDEEAVDDEYDPASRGRIVVMLISIVGAGILFERIGYFATAALFLFVTILCLSRIGWWKSALAALAGAWVSLVVFRDVLSVALPGAPIALPF